ncbi:unnamed protein product [Ectocarpus sp. 12 AP-2014]
MYDNNSSDKSRQTLRRFELSKFVQVLDWPYEGGQTEALNDCLCRFRHTTRWMSFLDVDEFVDPAPGLPIQATGNLRLADIGQLESPPIQFNERAMGARRKRNTGWCMTGARKTGMQCDVCWMESRGEGRKVPRASDTE